MMMNNVPKRIEGEIEREREELILCVDILTVLGAVVSCERRLFNFLIK